MEEPLDVKPPKGKIFKEKSLLIGTFLAGPLAAGYIFAENFKVLEQPDKVKQTWIITIMVSILIFGGIVIIPEDVNIPNVIFPMTYTVIVYSLFRMLQAQKVNEHIVQGGEVHDWIRLLLVTLIATLFSLITIVGLGYAYDTYEQSNYTTKSYGSEVVHEIDYNKNNITEAEVDKIAEGLKASGFFDLVYSKYVYVEKNGKKYEISISSFEGIENDPEGLKHFEELRDQMDDYLPDHDIEIKLVVDYLDNVVKTLD